MVRPSDNLWRLIRAAPAIDATALCRAVEEAATDADDFRTKLLIRDSLRAIENHWGTDRLRQWLSHSPSGGRIQQLCESIQAEAANEHGFPSLRRRVVDALNPNDVVEFLRRISRRVTKPTRLIIGGSVALIMNGSLHRQTDDIDVVNEVPAELRTQHELLADLEKRYGLHLAHFQSHYLPEGWEQRIHSLDTFGSVHVFLVDAYDVFLTKVFSHRSKDQDDLRAVLPHLDRSVLETRLNQCTAALRGEEKLRQAAEENWYVMFGENLPVSIRLHRR